MYIVEILLKKRRFSALYQTVWPPLCAALTYPPGTEDEPEQRLLFFGTLTYASVYESSLAVGMSTSAGHYLARTLLRQLKFDAWMNETVIATFSPSDAGEEAYAGAILSSVAALVATLREQGAAGIEAPLEALACLYRKVPCPSH